MAEINLVQIELQELLLGEHLLNLKSEQHFPDLAVEIPFRRKKQRARQLLSDRARALSNPSGDDVGEHRARNADEIDTSMFEKPRVFRGDHRVHQRLGNFLDRQRNATLDARLTDDLLIRGITAGDKRRLIPSPAA